MTLRSRALPGVAVLQTASDADPQHSLATRRPAIQEFSAAHRSLKDAIKRAVELEQALSEPRLHDLERARTA